MKRFLTAACTASIFVLPHVGAQAQVPAAVDAPTERLVTVVQAEGAQIYECKADTAGKDVWMFRGPVATLMVDGSTVGRHFEGPSWEMADGSAIKAKAVASAPGAAERDIPLLKLSVTEHRGTGSLSSVTTIQRLKTNGGVISGPCSHPGMFINVPYSAEYRFLQKID